MRLWVRAALALSVLLFVVGLTEDFEDPKAAAIRVCGLAVAAAALGSSRSLRHVTWTALDAAVLAWLVTECLATLFSVAPILSLVGDSLQREGLSTSLAMAGLYLGARLGTRDPNDARRTLDVALAAITIASAYALLQAAGIDWIAWAPRVVGGAPIAAGRPSATLGHPTELGVVSGAGAVAAIGLAFIPGRGRWWRASAAAVCVGATLVTLTRAAWLGLGVGAGVVAILMLRAGALRGRLVRVALAGVALLAVVVLAAQASGWSSRLAARFGELLHPERGSGASRVEIWHTALEAWRARPWLGWGPGTFGMIFPRYQTAALWKNEWGIVPFHAHSVYLQALATRGVVGLAGLAFWVVALVAAARAVWRRGLEDRVMVATSVGLLTAVAVAGGFGTLGIAGETLIVTLSGMLSARVVPPVPAPVGWPGLRVGLLAAIAAALWGAADLSASASAAQAQLWLDQADALEGRALREARERALAAAGRAAALAPGDDRIARLHADALFALADVSSRPVPLMLEATREARRALRLVPEGSGNYLCLGRVLGARVAMGDHGALAEARATLERAARLAPTNPTQLGECARMDLILGDVDRAMALASRATRLYPDDGSSRAMLARALVRAGDARAGAAEFRRALAGEWHGDLAGREQAARELRLLGD